MDKKPNKDLQIEIPTENNGKLDEIPTDEIQFYAISPGRIKNKGMVGIRKKFNKKLYQRYDLPARDKIKNLLGDYVTDNPDQYGADLIINSDKCKYDYLELQVCTKWVAKTFPFEKPYLHARKAKYDENTLFLVLNKHMTKGLLFDRSSLNDEARRIKKYSREFVYDVEWNKTLLVHIEHLDRETLDFY